jgi:hypothetical protein
VKSTIARIVPFAALLLLAFCGAATQAAAFTAPEVSPQQAKVLKDNFALCVGKLKGPYTENTCVCPDGRKLPIRNSRGVVAVPCKDALFCSAFRAPWAEALTKEGVYIGNIFSRDLYLWDSFPDHDDLVRGYILENFFVETHPNHKLSQLRGFRGLSSSEDELPAAVRFYERYLSDPAFNDTRDFLLAYELQKRYLVRADVGQVQKIRNLASRLGDGDPKFKLLRDGIHNQLSAGLVPQLEVYRDKQTGARRAQVDQLIAEIIKLTTVGDGALRAQVAEIADPALQARLTALLPADGASPGEALNSLGALMVLARQSVASRAASPADARRLVDLEITATGEVQARGNAILERRDALTATQALRLLGALTNATYGVGLLTEREREAALASLKELEANPTPTRAQLSAGLERTDRVVEWAQANATLAFAEVLAPWQVILPQTAGIRDDILRGSPLLLYAQIAGRLDEFASGGKRARHDLFGAAVDTEVRALNPGLALGRLRVAPKRGGFTRDDIVALPETPADLDPAAGILTQGEGNMLSHVQLLARALGIPNVVLGPSAYARIAPHDGQEVFLIVTPGGRVIIKQAAAMTASDRAIYEEYTRNQERAADGSLGGKGAKLHIDRAKLDLGKTMPIDLTEVRRSDSGRFCGPKAAYLGELKHAFPDKVARGLVVPFGAYYTHFKNATVSIPESWRGRAPATAGEPLLGFVERMYAEFFDRLVPAGTSERELADWIQPRLEIVRYSIRQAPLSPELETAIREGLKRNGLMTSADQSVGCFVRSDTNVEDLDNFNGAGLNLTVFNRKSLADIYSGLKEVWASPFSFRSFSWRQTLIDDPLWVLSSVVILESIPSDKSGVLVTADPTSGEPGKMLVATSEGVGGAVDGTSAETLLWSPQGVELITLFKSPWKTQLVAGGGSTIGRASGSDTVLSQSELAEIIAAGEKITTTFAPVQGPTGRPRPWDIEFGFASGKLWLFQCRPFLGNDQLQNVAALAPLEDATRTAGTERVSLEETI